MTWRWEPIWGTWPTLLIGLGLGWLLWRTTRAATAHLAPGPRSWLLGLRLASWLLLWGLACRPAIEWKQESSERGRLLLLTDRSRSMEVADGPQGLTRRDWLLRVLEESRKELDQLREQVDFTAWEFDEAITEVAWPQGGPPVGPQTAVGDALEQVARRPTDRGLTRVLLLSDGAQRAIPPHDIDPRTVTERLADRNIVVDTVCLGSTSLEGTGCDLVLEEFEVSPTVFVKNTVIASGKVRVLGAAGRELTVRLSGEPTGIELPAGGALKPLGAPLKLKPTRGDELLPIEVSFVAEQPGEFRLKLEVEPLPDEATNRNNSLTTYLNVLKGGISVAYFDIERAEQKLLRRIDDSPHIRLDFKPLRQLPDGRYSAVEPTWFEPGKYDVYIVGGVAARAFDTGSLQRLALAVEQGAGLLMTGGTLAFGPGGYGASPLAAVLPVEMPRSETVQGSRVDPALYANEPQEMVPSARGLQHFVMRLEQPAKNLEAWHSLPPLRGVNRFAALKPGAMVLAESPGEMPLLVAQEVGRGRSLAFAGYTTYTWALSGYPEQHQRFWEQAVLWLAHKDTQGDEPVWLKLEGRRFRPGQPVRMTFGARNPDGSLADNAVFEVAVSTPDGQSLAVSPVAGSGDASGVFDRGNTAGEYTVRVNAKVNGQVLGLGSTARFSVIDRDLELTNAVADPGLLAEIARATAGTVVRPEDFAAHVAQLKQASWTMEREKVITAAVWDRGWWLLLATLLLGAEWWLRKRIGLV
ncbi:MAG: glutamine amidotransferase [Planctomycetaceae bacterium]